MKISRKPLSARPVLLFAAMKSILVAVSACSAAAQSGARLGSPWQPLHLDQAEFVRAAGPKGVLLATKFGAQANDGRDDSRAIAAALEYAHERGVAAVLLPAGRYHIASDVRLVSGVALLGEGCGRTIVKRSVEHRGKVLLRIDGVSHVRVQGISFEYDGAREFFSAIAFRGRGSREVAVLDNCFDDAKANLVRGDRFAIVLAVEHSPNKRVWIGRNRASGRMQLTGGGGAGVQVLRIVDNEVHDAKSNGIAVTHGGPGAVFSDLLIARNRIYNSVSLGIYIGPDKPQASGSVFENVAIVGNSVLGFSRRNFTHGIYVRAAERKSSGITIAGNRLDGRGSSNDIAITLVDKHGGGRRRITNVIIENNEAVNFERGIWLGSVHGGLVRGNRMSGSRPYIISPTKNTDVAVLQ